MCVFVCLCVCIHTCMCACVYVCFHCFDPGIMVETRLSQASAAFALQASSGGASHTICRNRCLYHKMFASVPRPWPRLSMALFPPRIPLPGLPNLKACNLVTQHPLDGLSIPWIGWGVSPWELGKPTYIGSFKVSRFHRMCVCVC